MPTFMHIRIDGNDLSGQSQYSEMGGVDLADHTEILSFYHDLEKPIERQSGLSSAHLNVSPVTVVKGVDGISPAIWQACAESQIVDASLRWFVRNLDGAWVQAGRLILLQGKITGVRTEKPAGQANDASPPLERVSILANTMRLVSETASTEYVLSWNQQA